MSYYKELDYGTTEIGTVVGVQFSVLSPEEIERRSVAEVITQETYDGDMPKVGGLFDRRMGVLDPGMLCLSCGQKSNLCPGHLGHIRLASPVFHVQFMSIIMKTIQMVCYRCAKTLVNLEDSHIKRNLLKRGPKQRFTYLYALSSKVKRCGEKNPCGCGALQPSTIKRDTNGIGRIILEFKISKDEEKKRLIWTADQVYRVFKQISTDEAELMGFNKFWCRPDWLICTVLPVPPPSVRPSVRNDTNTRMEDDLTHKLCDIVKTNRALKQKIEANAPKNIIDEWTQLLQYHVSTLIDNNLPGVPQAVQRSGRPLKSIKDRLKSKEGRVRGNLMGKRVDYSARSVISPDPNLEIDELGVPIKIAKNLTFPEIVTRYNKEWLTGLVINGPDTFPGAKSYKRNSDKQVISLKHIDRNSVYLSEGDVVNRHLVDGDTVLFNRQPSLHRMSMMAHRVRVMPYNTFRMNPNATTPYNADFDGDEMNMHVPQSEQTRIELEALASVPTQIITPAENRPIISIVQDTLVGAYRFTKYDNFLTHSQVMDLLAWNKRFNGEIPEPDVKAGTPVENLPAGFPLYKYNTSQDLWSGRTILSTVLPEINLVKPNGSFNSLDEGHNLRYQNLVKIINGKIESGVFDKSLLGANEQGVIHIIFNEYGPRAAKEFLDNTMSLITNWMLLSSFSVGVSDLIINETAQQKITEIIADKKDKVALIVQSIHDGTFQNDTGKSNANEFEIKVNGALNQAIQDTGIEVAKHQLKNNRMVNMVESGSKGTKVNIAQITACVGQQNVDGKRCPYGFTNRTLPHFNKFDDGPMARGFVENSFLQGLNPQEFFFHSMGGREGIIDTAIKTSESGYIQRRLIKAMEDLKVCQDQTIRGDTGNIVQFLYGEDGFNPEKVEKQKIPSIGMNIQELQKNYLISPSENWSKFLDPNVLATFSALKADARKDFYSRMLAHYQQILADRSYIIEKVFKMMKKDEIYHPVNIRRILTNAVVKFKQAGEYLCDFDPSYALNKIDYLKERLFVKENNPANRNYHILINSLLSPKYIMMNFKLTKSALDYVAEQIECQYMEAFASPGQLVGIIAAQSIGQPCTQMSAPFASKALIITEGEEHYFGPIGKFIDNLIKQNKSKVITLGPDSIVLDLDKPFKIVGVSDDEKTSWKKISQVSRHPANGGLVKVITRSGKTTTATLTHSFLKRSPLGIEPILGSDLKEGDRIPVASYIPTISNPIMTRNIGKTVYNLDYDFGWFAGIYLADGSINCSHIHISKIAHFVEERLSRLSSKYNLAFSTRNYQGEYGPSKDNIITDKSLAVFLKNEFKTGSYDKSLPAWVYASNIDFIRGLLSGYFDGDGNVNASKHMLRVSSRSETLINDICILLSYVGIFASLLNEKSVNQPGKTQYNLSIPKKYAEQFKKSVGFNMTEKAEELDKIIQWNNRNARHDNKEYIDKIPACGQLIADIGKALNLPEQSAYYKRWINKPSIGRRTLQGYIITFEAEQSVRQVAGVSEKINLLKQAVNSNVIWDEIVRLEYLDDPKEFVYDFTVPGNDSFMIDTGILVHNTLNSVAYDTELLIKVDEQIKIVKIGDYIDNYIPIAEKTEDHPNNTKLAYINNNEEVYVPSVDEDGKTMWQRVEALTRHPVVNKDGTNTVLEVFTKDGRTVIATKAKSFLTIDEHNKLVATEGSDLKIGDYIPVNNRAFEMPEIRNLDLSKILSKKEYVFGTEVIKALEINQSYKDKGMKKGPWWKNHVDKDFVLPYTRSDAFLEAANGIPREGSAFKQSFENGIIYPKKQWCYSAHIPEHIPLDFDFGYLVGAYLAEGCLTDTQISIANNELEYFVPINRLTEKWGITTKVYRHENKGQEGWTSTDIRIYSVVLTDILKVLCGKGSENKFIHKELFNSNKEFMKGLLSAYFGGDGCCQKNTAHISAFSVSRKLLENIQSILCFWFGIYNKITKNKKQETNNIGSKNILQGYSLNIKSDSSKTFAREIPILIGYKQDALNMYLKLDSIELRDIIPRYAGLHNNYVKVNRSEIIKKEGVIPFENVRFDEIIKINEIANPTEWVYDLTVENTRTFALINGFLNYDTFHFAGISAKSAVTRGLPRLKEIISVSKNIKSPQMTVYLEEPYGFEKERAKSVLNTIEITTIKDICVSSRIYFDPITETKMTLIDEDRELMEIYDYFQDIEGVSNSSNRSPWILRLEFDKSKMFDKDIRMSDVYYTIQSKFANELNSEINFIYSDDNASKLVFRFQFIIKDTPPTEEKSEDMILTIKNLEKTILNDVVIKGIKGVNSASMEKTDSMLYKMGEKSEDYEPKSTWVLYTEGSNLLEIFSHPHVDASRTFTNNIYEIYETLGIEAAREVILSEITDLIGSDGTYINFRHTSLLADTMVNRGGIMSIDRHGINKSDRGPLPKCSFEETTDMLAQAAIFSELDKMTGVSSNIMFGQEVPSGTGFVDVLFDEEKYLSCLATIEEDNEIVENSYEADYNKAAKIDLYCAENNFTFNTSI
jgi:DNA-directed RNA polymerase beta' subunit